MVIASPAGPYFKGGVKPLTLWLTEEYTRAGRGGMGAAKTGGNYASSLVAQQEATSRAATRWSSSTPGGAVRRGAGGMNMYFVFDDGRVVTPATGTILEGITRSAIIELAGKMGHQVEERKLSIDEWRDGVAEGRITEVFACGTAAVVTPVGSLKWDGGQVEGTGGDTGGELTMAIRRELVDIQFGRADDTFGWMHRVVYGLAVLPAGDLGAERVQSLLPERPERCQPGVDLRQGTRLQRVDPPSALRPGAGEAALAEHTQVHGHRRLADPELGGDHRDHLAGRVLALGEQLQDPASHRVAEHVERVHRLLLPGVRRRCSERPRHGTPRRRRRPRSGPRPTRCCTRH
jgi:hypothetical protein